MPGEIIVGHLCVINWLSMMSQITNFGFVGLNDFLLLVERVNDRQAGDVGEIVGVVGV